MTHENSNAV